MRKLRTQAVYAGIALVMLMLAGCNKPRTANGVATGQQIAPATPPPDFVAERMRLREQAPKPGPTAVPGAKQ